MDFRRGDRTRTCDSLVPNQERYQLRYTPYFLDVFLKSDAKVQHFLILTNIYDVFFDIDAFFLNNM